MVQYISKDALVAEIKRLKTIYNDDENIHHVAKYNILVDILSFLDTLEVKEVDSLPNDPISEDLKEAAEKCIESLIPETELNSTTPFALEYVVELLHKAFKAGANWQKKQDEKDIADMLFVARLKGADDGKRIMKEQMMKNAITAECFGLQSGDALFSIRLPVKDYLVGSEVKVIIIKEDKA